MCEQKKKQINPKKDTETINKIRTINSKLRDSLNLLLHQDEWNVKNGEIEWPGSSQWEIMMGAILVQRSSWKNTKKALENLKNNNLDTPEKILNIEIKHLSDMIKPAGFPTRKAKTIIELAKLIKKHSSIDNFFKTRNVRNALLSIYGIGDETADVIMLYAGHLPAIPVSEYTRRILSRVLAVNKKFTYKQWQTLISASLNTISDYKAFHALMSELGYHYCKPKPLCIKCPLSSVCSYAMQHKIYMHEENCPNHGKDISINKT